MKIAVIENNKISNIIVANSLKEVQEAFSSLTLIEENETTGIAIIGSNVINGKFETLAGFEAYEWDSNETSYVIKKAAIN